MEWTKEGLINKIMSNISNHYKRDSTVYQRVKRGLWKMNKLELDNLHIMIWTSKGKGEKEL